MNESPDKIVERLIADAARFRTTRDILSAWLYKHWKLVVMDAGSYFLVGIVGPDNFVESDRVTTWEEALTIALNTVQNSPD